MCISFPFPHFLCNAASKIFINTRRNLHQRQNITLLTLPLTPQIHLPRLFLPFLLWLLGLHLTSIRRYKTRIRVCSSASALCSATVDTSQCINWFCVKHGYLIIVCGAFFFNKISSQPYYNISCNVTLFTLIRNHNLPQFTVV